MRTDCDRLMELLEQADRLIDSEFGVSSDEPQEWEALPLARQLIEENERLKKFSKTKGEVIEGGQRVIADLQARLSAAEERERKQMDAIVKFEQGRDWFFENDYKPLKTKLKRAEEVVEAAKKTAFAAPGIAGLRLREAIRRYEKGKK